MCSQDCCQLVEDALERFPKDARLQTQGCRAVTNLFNGEANIEKASHEYQDKIFIRQDVHRRVYRI